MVEINEAGSVKHSEKPLITFALVAYNQDKYVKEAIDGAFAQTYSPLEIILSDDNSKDRTFEIMQYEVEKYRGSHKIIINRNPQNLRLAGHINRIMELSQGELIVIAAGDDISLPARVEKIVNIWNKFGREVMSIHSSAKCIDYQGNFVGMKYPPNLGLFKDAETIAKFNPAVRGATHAWHRTVFDKFPPLNLDVIHEDRTIIFRSALLGKVLYLDEPLIIYRLGVGVTKQFYSYNNYKELLYDKGRAVIERFRIDAIQKRDDASHIDRRDLVIVLGRIIKRYDLSLLFARREVGLIQIIRFSAKEKISIFEFLKQFIKYKAPIFYFESYFRVYLNKVCYWRR